MNLRTSQSHPLQIANIQLPDGHGRIGITFCPGKYQPAAMTGGWARDLDSDLAAIQHWGASAVVSLIEPHEMQALQVPHLGEAVTQRHMHWYHLPITDVSVPDAQFEAQWQRASAELRHMLHAGFSVLVHCRGGLGRAGMIAAALLVELGEPAPSAIARVRQARPGAIETRAQEAYVTGLSALGFSSPDQSEAACADRARGALLGLAVGDALGTTLEFSRRDSTPFLSDMVGGGPFRLEAGQWTDDSAMALALADSLHEKNGLDEADLMARFVDWHENGSYSCTGRCFDIGITTRAALSRWKASGNPLAGSTAPDSAGNGSLMRLAPIAIRYWRDRPSLRHAAAQQSRTTHGAPQAVEACVAYAELLSDAIAGVPRHELLRDRRIEGDAVIAKILGGAWRGKARREIAASGYVGHSLEAALWSVGRSGNYRQAILSAANLGDDADTTAAIAGQLAGAIEGAGAIPAPWLQKLAWRERLTDAADRLFAAS
ncbi:DraG ADP-ribosylglycohydrolase [Sphingomonadaceae bacterium]